MTTKPEMQKKLDGLRREYRSVYSMLSMMEKGTKESDLARMREEKLDPIKKEIQSIEKELAKLA
jgi:hypothetical protein